MGYTEQIEKWITDAKLDYMKETRKSDSASDIFLNNNRLQKYVAHCRRVLDDLRQKHSYTTLGFAMIRLLHRKTNPAVDELGMCEIYGEKVNGANINDPQAITSDDIKKYVKIFTQIALRAGRLSGKKTFSEDFLTERFSVLFKENVFVKNTPTRQRDELKKEHVAEICFCLGWRTNDLEFLLLRTDFEGLNSNSREDQILRFCLDDRGANWNDRENIKERIDRLPTSKNAPGIVSSPGTYVTVRSLSEIINNKSMNREQRLKEYSRKLYEYGETFDHHSRAARNIFEHILLYVAFNLGWRAALLNNLPKKILDCKVPRLTADQQERLVKSLFSDYSETTADLFSSNEQELHFKPTFLPSLYSYPHFQDDTITAVALYDRILPILRGHVPVKKADILYALFLLTVTASDSGKHPVNPVDDYYFFIEKANIILTSAYLEPFYPAQVLEFTIGKALLARDTGAVFHDVTRLFVNQKEQQIDEDYYDKGAGTKMPRSFTDRLKKKIDKNIKRDISKWLNQIGIEVKSDLKKIAEEIYKAWEDIGCPYSYVKIFPSGNIEFGTVSLGYFPVILKQKLEQTSELYRLLFDKTDTLDTIRIPIDGYMLTLYELAQYYRGADDMRLGDYFIKHPILGLRYRQHILSRILATMVMEKYTDTREFRQPEVFSTTGRYAFFKFGRDLQLTQEANPIEAVVLAEVETNDTQSYSKVYVSSGTENQPSHLEENAQTSDVGEDILISEIIDDSVEADSEDNESDDECENMLPNSFKQMENEFNSREYRFSITAEDQEELFSRIKENKHDQEAIDKLINANLWLLTSCAKKYWYSGKNVGLEPDDLAMCGFSGLLKAVQGYDPVYKTKFSSYAMYFIRGEMIKEIRKNSQNKLPKEIDSQLKKIWKIQDQHYMETGRNLTTEELAEPLEVSPEKIAELLSYQKIFVSKDAPISDENESTFAEMIDDSAQHTEEQAEQRILVEATLRFLSPREADIIRLYYGFTDEQFAYPPDEIAKKLRIPLEEVIRAWVKYNRLITNPEVIQSLE